jgi:HPt (histidine-containing phosphotransfer) domain-containing protein
MNRETGAWLAVALLSISALGVSATALDAATTTDANDVVHLDYDSVPIGQDTASNVLDEIEGRDRGEETASRTNPDAQDPTSAARTRQAETTSAASSSAQRQSQAQQRAQSQGDQEEGGTDVPSLLDRILALLAALLKPLLVLAALLGAAGLVVRYRDRLLAVFEEPVDEDGEDATVGDGTPWDDGSPDHVVESAWLGMVRRLDLDQPGTMTTSECARAAIEAGLDREAVRTITEAYEEVRYGDQPVTERRRKAARRSQQRLDAGGGA